MCVRSPLCAPAGTVHSLSKMLGRHYKVKFIFVAPEQLRMPREVVEQLPAECEPVGSHVTAPCAH